MIDRSGKAQNVGKQDKKQRRSTNDDVQVLCACQREVGTLGYKEAEWNKETREERGLNGKGKKQNEEGGESEGIKK